MLRRFTPILVLVLLMAGVAFGQEADLDPFQSPVYGEYDLAAGFTPAPFELPDVTVNPVVSAESIPDCVGYTTPEPTLRLYWTGDVGVALRVYFASQSDTTLIVRDPNGNFACNDDANDWNPRVEFADAESGEYAIWVGMYEAEGEAFGTLSIDEGNGELCTTFTPLSEADSVEIVDDVTAIVTYANQQDQRFVITVRMGGAAEMLLEEVLRETSICLLATEPIVLLEAPVDEPDVGSDEAIDPETGAILEIEVENIGELMSEDYEVHLAVDPSVSQTYSLSKAQSVKVTSLCAQQKTNSSSSVTGQIWNTSTNRRVWSSTDAIGGVCAASSTVTANQLRVSGASGSYFTLRSTWGNFN